MSRDLNPWNTHNRDMIEDHKADIIGAVCGAFIGMTFVVMVIAIRMYFL